MKTIGVVKTVGFPSNLGAGKLALVKEDGHLNLEYKGTQDTKSMRARRSIRLKGDVSIPRSYPGHPYTYQYLVENYDSFTEYSGSTTAGSIDVSGEGVNLTTPTTGDRLYITINGEVSRVMLRQAVIGKPIITYPLNNGVNAPLALDVLLSGYFPEVPSEPFELVEWVIASDINFTQNVKTYSKSSATPLLNLSIFGLFSNTLHYLRVRFKGMLSGYSEWSDTVSFTTVFSEIVGVEQTKLIANDGIATDNLGRFVALSGDGNTAACAAPYRDDVVANSGAIYIYVRNGASWTFQTKLLVSDPTVTLTVGYNLKLSYDGNTLAIGSPFSTNNGAGSGAFYIFTRNGTTWSQEAKVFPVDGVANANFGYALSLSPDGNTLAVGARTDDDLGTNSGSVYLYLRSGNTWSKQAKLIADDGSSGHVYGCSVALSGDGSTLAVGSPISNGIVNGSGSVYIYILSGSTWIKQSKLIANDGVNGDNFGYVVSLSADGSTVLIGAPIKTTSGSNGGGAYIFKRAGISWSQQSHILPLDNAAGDKFGYTVSLSYNGQLAAIGAPYNNSKGINSGSVYIYTVVNTVWDQKLKLSASDGIADDNFGISVSLNRDGNQLLIGSWYSDPKGSSSGAAYIFI